MIEDEEDVAARENAKSKWAQLAKLVGAQPRLEQVARISSRTSRRAPETMEGKAMFVAMSRDICVALFDEIVKLRPEWAGTKIVTGWDGDWIQPGGRGDSDHHDRQRDGSRRTCRRTFTPRRRRSGWRSDSRTRRTRSKS